MLSSMNEGDIAQTIYVRADRLMNLLAMDFLNNEICYIQASSSTRSILQWNTKLTRDRLDSKQTLWDGWVWIGSSFGVGSVYISGKY